MAAGALVGMTRHTWTDAARGDLLGLQGRDGGWGYRRDSAACAEPTALAGLALLADAGGPAPEALGRAADWLAAAQRPDGSVGVSAARPAPGWMTPYALLLWKATGAHEGRCRTASHWLLARKGRTLSKGEDPGHVAGHDTTLVGWPWVADTHSWLEPTAMAVLALAASGLAEHPRVREGLRLIRDRQVESGGWNYGNKAVYGRPLRAQPAPTGMALLALALAGAGSAPETIGGATRYLTGVLPGVRASASLGWGLLGLRAWGVRPEHSADWLAEAFASLRGRPDAAPRLACLLLAAGETSLALFARSGPLVRS